MAAPVTTYKQRLGNAIPIVGTGSISTGVIIFTFGFETQEVLSCGSTHEMLKSTDMCLMGGNYFSANYKALPGKVGGKVAFSSVTTKKPILSTKAPPSNGDCLRGDY